LGEKFFFGSHGKGRERWCFILSYRTSAYREKEKGKKRDKSLSLSFVGRKEGKGKRWSITTCILVEERKREGKMGRERL